MKYTIEQLEAMSDRELGASVTNKAYGENQWDIVDINSWADIGEIIGRERIMLNPYCADELWKAEAPCGKDGIITTYAKCHDKNPLRAAAIVYLMMGD